MNKKTINFMGAKNILFAIPIVIFAVILVFFAIFGVEVAIEFKGGTMLTYSYEGEVDVNAVKSVVEGENYGSVNVTLGTAVNSSLNTLDVSFSSNEGLTAEKQGALTDKLKESFKDNNLVLVDSQDVNPSSGFEFFLKCFVAVIFSFILLVIYIAFRFKKIGGFSAGVFALVALVHDVIMVFGTFVLCRFSIDANFIAVVLTVLGNSINNTIVVYDRIRENRGLYGNSISLRELTNMSITQSLSRSINTTLTTAFAVLAICVVCAVCGVISIMTFAIPMMVGLVCGTYSSLFISGPLWVLWREHRDKSGASVSGTPKASKKNTKDLASKGTIDKKKLMV